MLRRLFNFVSILSLVLLIAVLSMVVRGAWATEGWSWAVQSGTNDAGMPLGASYTVVSNDRGLNYVRFWGHERSVPLHWVTYAEPTWWIDASDNSLDVLGFSRGGGVCGQLLFYTVPYWFLAALFAVTPAARMALYFWMTQRRG